MTYTVKSWSLSDLFATPEDVDSAFKEIETKTASLETKRAALRSGISPESFLKILDELEQIYRIAYRLGSYGGLRFSTNTQDPAALNFIARVDQFNAQIANRLLFIEMWWKDLHDADAARLMEGSGDYRYWLEKMRLFKPHTLSEPEEKIINIKDVTGSRALETLYNTLTNRYTYKIQLDGQEKEVSREELMTYIRRADPDLRARAYQELFRVYAADSSILSQIYQTLARDWGNEQVDVRHFSAPMAARNLRNHIPDEAVNTLLEVCERNAPLFQRYFQLKARWIGLPRLRRYDIYAPVAKSEKTYPFNDAVDMVLDSFNKFDPSFREMAKRVLDQDHLDSEDRKGKQAGAFCAGVLPGVTPYVLVSYKGRSESVTTLAHELGHAIHDMLASNHTTFTYYPPLPLAETASTFGEMMLVDRLLSQEKDENVRRDLLFNQVDGAYATIMRQAFFALFERKAHEMTRAGASAEEISQAYFENLQRQFGDAVELADEFRWEWITIPHIYHTPFYVYAYSFGQLLVFSLYKQYKEEGEAFKPRYIKLLAAGGSAAPEQILSEAGIDIRSANFWQGGFDVLEGLIRQLEALPVNAQ